MDLATAHNLYESLARDRWAFLYSGQFHDEHSARLIVLAEEASNHRSESDRALVKKLAFVLVEAYQNIIRHRSMLPAHQERGEGRSFFILRSDGRSYEVAAMNPIRNAETERLNELLANIKANADLKQLKEMFLRGLQGNSASPRGGAGLGLIEMARRSTSGLQHKLTAMDDESSMFTLLLRVGTSDMIHSQFADIFQHQQAMSAMDILLVFKGEFTAPIQTSILRMFTTDMGEHAGRKDASTRAFLAAMEMISETPDQLADAILLLGRSDGMYSLVAGMQLTKAAAHTFEVRLKEVAAMDHQTAQRKYRDALIGRNADESKASTGLLDLAARSRGALKWGIFPTPAGRSVLIEVLI